MRRVILASTSPTRAAILKGAGVSFERLAPNVDEGEVKARLTLAGEGPLAIARALAAEKAGAVAQGDDALVIGADQTLECDGGLMDKASSLAEARANLICLRGRGHLLHSALALAQGGEIVWRGEESARLLMRRFSDEFLDDYLAGEGGQVLTTVGGYALEGRGAQLFERIEGDYFAILGLPLLPLLAALRVRGALIA